MSDSNVTFVLVEGKHDTAILSRLLRLNNFSDFTDKKITDFPNPLKGFLEGILNKFEYQDEANVFQKPQLPNKICKDKDSDNFYVFYQMGGDSQFDYVINLIELLKVDDSSSEFFGEQSFDTDVKFSLQLFFDADVCFKNRKREFATKYAELLPNFIESIDVEDHQYFSNVENIDGFSNIGIFIYGEGESGTLEDIIIPLMRDDKNEALFQKGEDIISEFMPNEEEESCAKKKQGIKSKKGKALIGIVGQPKHQGKANQVIINDTKFITKGKLDNNDTFKEIFDFMT
ncbi:hypothetical protein MY04_4235 [Flammeovirga sp. MY04]|uniref:DUF3226 domain-containing protein n=1 Tax=Flammeovirga sp. MY04 TaxID=1191459 RepID=UPI0008062FE6|nr:DUF3226 domain-containing protein [Flammeovirga sp. MY04]ANQ51577.1 hypothetical protein MY04_4235 [Flammeovirga sp. MY04]